MFWYHLLIASFLSVCAVHDVRAQPTPTEESDTEPTITLEESINLRDPFRQPELGLAAGATEGGSIPELERFNIEEFKLVGIITGPKSNKALVTDPSGRMHVLTETVKIGRRKGYVKAIQPGRVQVEESVINILGQEEKVDAVIEFEKDDDDKRKTRL